MDALKERHQLGPAGIEPGALGSGFERKAHHDVGPGQCSASKAGLIGLTKSLGKELATQGVLVNAVAPAAARTAIFDQMAPEHIAYMLGKIPMGRLVDVAEVAAMVAWLASEDCSFSTGAVFDLSGGRATY